jgi:hypothetical protein
VPQGKRKQAQAWGTRVMSEGEFFEMIEARLAELED